MSAAAPVPEPLGREYAAAREGAALVDLEDRAVLVATGPKRQEFLNSLLSNAVGALGPGQGCLAALLDAKGHITALMRVLASEREVLLELPAERLEVVERTLAFYRVAAPVRFAARPVVVLGLLGPRTRDVLAAAGAPLPELAPESHVAVAVAGASALLARASDLPAAGLVVHLAPELAGEVRRRLLEAGAAPVGRAALDALRVEDGRPWYGPDVGEENLLHETGLLREYHSPTKGCYLGQEVVARLEGRGGHVNKGLRGLRLSAPAVAGSRLTREGQEVGRVTTAALSPRLGPIAMGYVHRTAFEPGTRVEVDGAPAAVVALPFEAPA